MLKATKTKHVNTNQESKNKIRHEDTHTHTTHNNKKQSHISPISNSFSEKPCPFEKQETRGDGFRSCRQRSWAFPQHGCGRTPQYP